MGCKHCKHLYDQHCRFHRFTMDVWNGERFVPWKRGYRNLLDICKPDGRWKRVRLERSEHDERFCNGKYKYGWIFDSKCTRPDWTGNNSNGVRCWYTVVKYWHEPFAGVPIDTPDKLFPRRRVHDRNWFAKYSRIPCESRKFHGGGWSGYNIL